MISRGQVIQAFQDSLAAHGISLSDPSRIELDGNWHRAHVEGDRGRAENLAYRIHYDDRPAGFWQDHKRGASDTFSVRNGEDLDPAARAAAQAAWREAQRTREAERERDYRSAAERAQATLRRAPAASPDHPYLARKGIIPSSRIRQDGGRILIPVYSAPNEVASYQTIDADGDKLFMPGGRMAGSYHSIAPPVGGDPSRVLVCEGYATGAALSAATGHPAACAMSAGNVPAVAAKLRALLPDRELVICPDNDWHTAERTGRNPGLDAAAGTDCRVVAPEFPADADPKHTDWDDWLRHYGSPEALRHLIDPAASASLPSLPDPVEAAAELMPRTFRVELQGVSNADDFVPVVYGESNIATRFAATITANLRFVDDWGRWMVWDGKRWQSDRLRHAMEASKRFCAHVSDQALKDNATFTTEKQKQTVAGRYTEKRTIHNVAELAKSDPRIAAATDQWDADLWALNTPAGVVDLRAGTLRHAERGDHMTKITRVAPGGSCPTWHQFLRTATAGDDALIAFLQRMAGYCLTGSTRDHALFFVYGTGGNGKGTFLNTLQWIIGDYAKASPMDVFTERKHDSHPTELAGLMGARMVCAQETEEGKRWAEARIKALTGGDPITARFMRQDDFTFMPQFKLVIAGNHKPGLRNVDEAIKRRLHIIPFTVTVAPQDRDPNLSEKLQSEAGGILKWAIDGCIQWQRDGLKPPASVLAATDEYLEQEDQFANWIADCCELGAYSHAAKPLYDSYRKWCEGAGDYAINQKRWAQQMATRGYESTRGKKGVMYRGLRLTYDESF